MGEIDRFLFLFTKSAPCLAHCRHCDFVAAGGTGMPMSRTLEALRPFVEARQRGEIAVAGLAALFGDCPLNDLDLATGVAYARQHDVEGWLSVPANGARPRSGEQWRGYLEGLRQAGTQVLEFTLYGLAQTHDQFARRRGDFARIVGLAALWQELGGNTMWGCFLHKGNLKEVGAVRDLVRERFGESCGLDVWLYLGNATEAEELRPEAADLEALGEARSEPAGLGPESEWVRALAEVEAPPFAAEPRVIHMALYPDGSLTIPYTPPEAGHRGIVVGRWPVESAAAAALEAWQRRYKEWCGALPPVAELCRRHGDAGGARLYDEQSVKRKWVSAHLRATAGA